MMFSPDRKWKFRFLVNDNLDKRVEGSGGLQYKDLRELEIWPQRRTVP